MLPDPAASAPPYDHAAEAAVLGGLLIDGDALLPVLAIVKPGDFHRVRHQHLYEACINLFNRREAIDPVTAARELDRQDRLESAGGPAYLGQLVANTPTAVNVAHYARIVADTALKRQLIDAGNRIAELGYADRAAGEDALGQAVDLLFAVRPNSSAKDFQPLSDAYDRYLQADDPDAVPADAAIPTGLADLDEIIIGLRPSDLIILGARPGFGKSSLAFNISVAAAKAGHTCGVFSLEMSFQQVADRILSAETGIAARRLSLGLYSETEADLITDRIGYLSGLPIYIDDQPMQTMSQMHAKAQRLQMERGLDLLVVDYLQLIEPPAGAGRRGANLVQQTSEISRALKGLARDLSVPVITCSQLSRAPETRQNHRPQLSDLRESGSIEQDADIVMFLYRPDRYHTTDEWEQLHPGQPYPQGVTEVSVAKHRHGATGTATLQFAETITRFYAYAPSTAYAA